MPRLQRVSPARVLVLFLVSLFWLVAGTPVSTQPDHAAHMKEHFTRVWDVQAAVMRGDLEAVREPAEWLATHEMTGWPPKTATQIAAMKGAAKRAAEAKDIRMAANASAVMASTCGTCHSTSGVTPKMDPPKAPAGTGMAAHMLAHQQAVEYLYQGLVLPSEATWNKGAELLKTAPLAKGDLPSDPALTESIKAFEEKIHQFATMARKAPDPKTRVGLYGEVIASCAECHGLHGKVWGPGLPK